MIIDVSKWQGKIDWLTIKNANLGIIGAYIKASEGIGYIDPNFKYNALEASKIGFKVGYYHFASLNDHNIVNDATKEANYFISLIKPFQLDLPLALDVESNSSKLSKEEVLKWINTFYETIISLGYKDYVLYSYTPFLNSNLPSNHNLGNIKLWLACYNDDIKLPNGWSKYWLWQYTQEGKIPGINNKTDLNKLYIK